MQGQGGKIWSNENRNEEEEKDPPSQLIGRFLDQQRMLGETSLDMDLEMEELRQLPPLHESSPISRRPPHPHHPPLPPYQHVDGNNIPVRSPSAYSSYKRTISSFQNSNSVANSNNSGLLQAKTRSRLLDQSSQMASGFTGKKLGDDEEEDPFLEEDLPDKYKNESTHFGTWLLLEWCCLILIVTSLITTLFVPSWRTTNLWELRLWKWEVTVLVLICGRLVSDWVIRILVFCIERNFLLRKRVLYFVYGVRKPVRNCLWLGLVLIAWHLLFDKKVEMETKSEFLRYITKVLVCFLVGTLVWLLKTLAVKVLASSFHVSTYFDRIQESLFNQFVIETLSGPPFIELERLEEDEQKLAAEVQKLHNAGVNVPPDLRATAFSAIKSKSGRFSRPPSNKLEAHGITIDSLHRLNPKNVSAWNMKRLIKMVRHGALSTLDEQILDSAHSTQITSENEAKAAAKKVFHNVARRGSKFIYPEDLMRFMREDETVKTINLFEGASETGKISKSALKNWVVNAFRERRALALTLNDTKTAVNKLHRMLNFVVAIIILVIWLLILGIATSKIILFVTSQLVLVAFVFGNTCKTIFEAIIFLFIMHPFDVGDRCEIDGVQVVVEEMNILTTIFLRWDNQKITIPNNVLATKAIYNYYRSPDMLDEVQFSIHITTPPEKIQLMRQRIVSYIDNKKEHWYPSPRIIFKDHDQLSNVKMLVVPMHRMNHQDMGERYDRRSLLIEEMIKIFCDLDIEYRLHPLDVSIRSMPTTSDRFPPSWATITS